MATQRANLATPRRRWLIVLTCLLVATVAIGYVTWRRSHALSPQLEHQRDQIIVEADRQIRAGLAQLASQYPQVQQALDGLTRFDDRAAAGPPSAHPHIFITMGTRGPSLKRAAGAPPEQFDASDFWIHINLYVCDRWPPPRSARPFGTQQVFPNLHMAAYPDMFYAAVDPQLDHDLKRLVDDALAPLAALDTEAGTRKRSASPSANAYPVNDRSLP